jgi:LuxR family quorum sensing-dependent transcriptional regulator
MSEDALAQVVQHHLSKLGFLGFTCSSFRVAGALNVHSLEFSTMPPDFVEAFVESQHFLQDPVARRARLEPRPFFWGDDDHDPLLEPHRQIGKLRDDVGVHGGCCATVLDRVGAQVSGGMVLNASGAAFRVTESTLTALQVIAGQMFCKLGMLRAARQGRLDGDAVRVAPGLTERERMVLSWVAAGKSSWEIGCILSISEHTVNSHIERAVSKLGAANRAEAVAKAIMLDLIGFEARGSRQAQPS